MRWPNLSPPVQTTVGGAGMVLGVIFSDATGGWSWLLVAAVGVMTIYSGLLLAFDIGGAWDRYMDWRRGAPRKMLLLSNLTRDVAFESRWLSGGLSIVVGVALLVLGAIGAFGGGLN